MTNESMRNSRRAQPASIDLSGIDTEHPSNESREHLIAVASAEVALGVTGVHSLGGRSRGFGSRPVSSGAGLRGVAVTRSDGGTVIELDLVVEYPHALEGVIKRVRTQVARAARVIFDEPVEVNVTVSDIHGPFDVLAHEGDQPDAESGDRSTGHDAGPVGAASGEARL